MNRATIAIPSGLPSASSMLPYKLLFQWMRCNCKSIQLYKICV